MRVSKRMKKIKGVLATSVVLAQVFLTSLPAFALDNVSVEDFLDIDSISDVFNSFEDRYHLNQGTLQEYGENLNVSLQKNKAPEVMLFFTPTDPKPGEELTAKAFPMYFSNSKDSLYFTWYLKREGCDLTNNPSKSKEDLCDRNGDNRITVADWKIEAMRKISAGDYDNENTSYASDSDGDGYKAVMGGNNMTDAYDYCYVHDFASGENYELRSGGNSLCKHLFASAPGHTTGDGSFGRDEEKFWRTDPHDPDTAQNGNKDEANVAGLGQDSLTWNYAAGDKVGVVVEGTSINPTKHDNASMMIMWGFSKNNCSVSNTGSYTTEIRGYDVTIPTANMDLNDCLEGNLVDPTQGGQAGRLEVSTSFSPQNPVASLVSAGNAAHEYFGDTLTVQSSVNNSGHGPANTSYDWRVEVSTDGTVNPAVWENITPELRDNKNIGSTQGTGLDALKINLNLNQNIFNNSLAQYFPAGTETGYLRVSVTASENFSSGVARTGKSSVIVKITATTKRIAAHTVSAQAGPDGKMRVSLGAPLCDAAADERLVCPVVKNQIIGLSFASSNNEYDSFAWSVNGKALTCTSSVSSSCNNERQGRTNFFPVTGNPGETYTVTLLASSVTTGKNITLTRNFAIVDPTVFLTPADENVLWRKYLGKYTDLDGSVSENYSTQVLQGVAGTPVALQPVFYPASLKENTVLNWSVDGVAYQAGADGNVELALDKTPTSIFNVSAEAFYQQSDAIRKALRDIWGISAFESSEILVDSSVQIEVVAGEGVASAPTPMKFFAALASYVPKSVVFFARLMVSMVMILFVSGVALSVAPAKRG
jgi:hypothetical protein